MRKLIFGMNVTLDGYIAAPGDDLGWSGPSDELFQWWLDQELAIGLLMYGRKLWEVEFPLADRRPAARRHPGADRVRAELAGHAEGGVLLDDRQGRLEHPPVTGDAVAKITRLKADDGEPMRVVAQRSLGRPCGPG